MTRRANARIAGVSYLLYIAVAMPAMILMGRATAGATDIPGKLANLAQHLPQFRAAILLDLASCFCAIVLGVTLWAVTRKQDPDIAMFGLACRAAEGIMGGVGTQKSLFLLWLVSASGATAPDAGTASVLGTSLLRGGGGAGLGAVFFSAGSLAFSWLLLRGRMIPAWLAWIGVIASISWLIGLPLQEVGLLGGQAVNVMYLLMLAFEVPVAFWLILKGADPPVRMAPAATTAA
jgi:hypothetical protein